MKPKLLLLLALAIISCGKTKPTATTYLPSPDTQPGRAASPDEIPMAPFPRLTGDDWSNGYDLGAALGRAAAVRGDRIPSDVDLRAAAHNAAMNSNNIADKQQFETGFKSGFAAGYKKASKSTL